MMVDQQDQAPEQRRLVAGLEHAADDRGASSSRSTDGSYEAQNLAEYSFMINGGSSLAPINTDVVVEVPADLIAHGRGAAGRDPRRHLRPPRSTRTSRRARPTSGSDPGGQARGGELSPPRSGPAGRGCAGSPSASASLVANDDDRPGRRRRRGARPARRERRRQEHADPHPLRAQPARRRRAPRRRAAGDDDARRTTRMAAGIGMVTQEFSLVGPMTVTENVMLAGSPLGRVDRKAARAPGAGGRRAARRRRSTPTPSSSSCRSASASGSRSSRRCSTTAGC